MTSELVEHYSRASEGDRLLRSGHGRLEFLRTQELIRRVLAPPAAVLDAGGGTGIHARWLAGDGHSVHLIDPVPRHIEVAAILPGVTAQVGDARRLPTPTTASTLSCCSGLCTTSPNTTSVSQLWPRPGECFAPVGS